MMISSLRSKAVVALTALVLVTGCTEGMGGMGTKQTVGTLGGATAGAVIGSQFGSGDGRIAAAAIGTLLGAWAGNEIGSSLDKADQAAAGQAINTAYAAPVGQTIRWNNPDSGNSGTITTTRDGYSQSGGYCREYQQTINVGGRQQTAYGTACQNQDGTWQVQK
jgi:surface antigen